MTPISDIYCNLDNETFVQNFRNLGSPLIAPTQNDNWALRLFLLRASRFPGSGFPFTFDPISGAASPVTAILSLRDLSTYPVTLASSDVLTPINGGWSGTFNLNTTPIASFLTGVAERPVAFCVDLVDASGNKLSPFRKVITLRARSGTAVVGALATGNFFYLPGVISYLGGGATAANGIDPTGLAAGSIFMFVINGSGSQWKLVLDSPLVDQNVDGGIITLSGGYRLERVEGL